MKQINQYRTQINSETQILESDMQSFVAYSIGTYKKVAIFQDDKILFSNFHNNTIKMSSGEEQKTMIGLEKVIQLLQENEIDKYSLVIIIGGGAMSDLIGMACSIYMRGVDFAIIPSTLLSMVDASIGGKNGINFGQNKNQLGSIYQPKYIVIDYSILTHLSKNIISQGMAEIVKYAVAFDKAMFDDLSQKDLTHWVRHSDFARETIRKSIAHKVDIVSRDPLDKGERKKLNFGHTIGHAIESISQISHGEAVALGMIAAVRFSIERGYASIDELEKLKQVLIQYQLPTKIKLDKNQIVAKIYYDKKKKREDISFIFSKNIGSAHIETIKMVELVDLIQNIGDELWS